MTRANVLDRFLDPFGAFLTPEVARRLVDFRVDELTQARIDELATKCNEGQLTSAEREEYDTYISVIDFITVLQAKARTVLEQSMANWWMRLYANVFVTAQAIGVSIALCRKRMQWLSASTLNIFGPDSMEETMPP